MKILYLIREPFGLAGTNASYMFPSVMSESHEVRVLAPLREGLKQSVVFSSDQLHVESLYEKRRKRMAEVCLHIKEFQPDIVHIIHNHEALLFPFYGSRLLDTQPKWICDIRSPLLAPKEKGVRWRRTRRRALLLQGYLDCIITHAKHSVKSIFPVCFKKVFVVPPGVDVKAFGQDMTSLVRPIRKFIFVGSVTPPREMNFLATAFMKLKEKSGLPITLDIFGGGNALDDLKAHVRSLGAEETINVRGVVQQQQLFQNMSSYDAGISYVPKKLYDNAPPLKTMEYAAAGLPILASNTNANRKFQKEGLEMRLFDNTVDDFCQVGEELIAQGCSTKRLGENMDRVQMFSWERIVEESLLPVYKYLVSQ